MTDDTDGTVLPPYTSNGPVKVVAAFTVRSLLLLLPNTVSPATVNKLLILSSSSTSRPLVKVAAAFTSNESSAVVPKVVSLLAVTVVPLGKVTPPSKATGDVNVVMPLIVT